MGAASLGVTLYTQTQVLTGFIYQSHEERLSDLLNNVSFSRPESSSFLELGQVTIAHTDGHQERLATTYINKATIQLVVVPDGDSARGIGAKVGPKPYPFVEKSSVPVRLHLPTYALAGSMHCASGERVRDLLEGKAMFLPLTSAKIRLLTNDHWWQAPFVAVNRAQISSLQEDSANN